MDLARTGPAWPPARRRSVLLNPEQARRHRPTASTDPGDPAWPPRRNMP